MNTPARPKGVNPVNSSLSEENRIITKHGYLTLVDNPRHAEFKIRIIIKKGTGNAVYRNYIRRIIRECLRNKRSSLKPFNDCVFYYHYKTKINYMDIQKELDDKISRLK